MLWLSKRRETGFALVGVSTHLAINRFPIDRRSRPRIGQNRLRLGPVELIVPAITPAFQGPLLRLQDPVRLCEGLRNALVGLEGPVSLLLEGSRVRWMSSGS